MPVMCTTCILGAHGGLKKALIHLDLNLQMVKIYHVTAEPTEPKLNKLKQHTKTTSAPN